MNLFFKDLANFISEELNELFAIFMAIVIVVVIVVGYVVLTAPK